jgi:D-3-phosphoglycerate dehydrogenase
MATVTAEISGAEAAITRNAGLDKAAMAAAPALRVLGNHGIGVDPVDVAYASEIGLPIVFTPYANVQSVAEHAVSLMLAVAKDIVRNDRAVRGGDIAYRYRGHFGELSGKTLGIVGFGRIGRRTAAIARAAFDMPVLVYSPSADPGMLADLGMQKAASLEALFASADVISLHVPLRAETRGLIGAEILHHARKGAILINTARGGLIDEPALIDALLAGRLAGAGLDVFASDAMAPDHPLLKCDNVILTPHTAGSTEECLKRTALQVVEQVLDVLEGRRPAHLVNPDIWARRRSS